MVEIGRPTQKMWMTTADDHHLQGKRISVCAGERNDDAAHEEVDRNSIEHAGQDELASEERQLAAEKEEDRGRTEGDGEVAEKAESGGAPMPPSCARGPSSPLAMPCRMRSGVAPKNP